MKWVVDASAARHSGILTDYLGLLPALDAQLDGDECHVIASSALAERLDGTLEHTRLHVLDVGEGMDRFRALNREVRSRIRAIGPDAVLLGHYVPMATGVPSVIRLTDAHLVDDAGRSALMKFYTGRERLSWRAQALAFRWSTASAGAVICATEAVAGQLLRKVPRLNGRVRVAPFGPPPRVGEGGRHRPGSRRRLLTMHVRPRKNIETILRALVRPELEGWTLTVLADLDRPGDRYERYLADLIRAMRLGERVISAGYQPDPEAVLRQMHEHDALVSLSRIESWNHTVVEAMSIGMPVIASDIACHREVCGDAAWLVECDAPGELAAAVREIGQGGDAVEARRIRGMERIRGLSWSVHAATVLSALREVGGLRARRPGGGEVVVPGESA